MNNECFILELREPDNLELIKGYYNGPDKDNYDTFLVSNTISEAFSFNDKSEAVRIGEYFSTQGNIFSIVTLLKEKIIKKEILSLE